MRFSDGCLLRFLVFVEGTFLLLLDKIFEWHFTRNSALQQQLGTGWIVLSCFWCRSNYQEQNIWHLLLRTRHSWRFLRCKFSPDKTRNHQQTTKKIHNHQGLKCKSLSVNFQNRCSRKQKHVMLLEVAPDLLQTLQATPPQNSNCWG